MLNSTRLLAIARKETIQLRRDTRSLILAFMLPLLLLVLFGYAISWDIDEIETAVLDQDRSAASRELLASFRSSGYFTLEASIDTPSEIPDLLDRMAVQMVVVIPPGFARDLANGRTVQVQAIVDGSDANTATIVLAYTRAVVQSYSLDVGLEGRTLEVPLLAETRIWYNEELSSRNMIVPGLVAVIMMIIAAMLTSLTIAREWERGTMEQLAATPVTRTEVVLGKLLPYVVIGLIDVAASAVIGVVIFGVPFQGDPFLLMALSLLFTIGGLALGIFISAVARSQLVASQMAMIVTFLPAFLLSGFMYPISIMPKPLQIVTHLVPARYFLVITRGIFLKGVGIEVLRLQGLLMLAFAVGALSLAILAFRKELR